MIHSLGVTDIDWLNLTTTFNQGGRSIVLKGDLSLTKARVSLKSPMKSRLASNKGFLIECRAMKGGYVVGKMLWSQGSTYSGQIGTRLLSKF